MRWRAVLKFCFLIVFTIFSFINEVSAQLGESKPAARVADKQNCLDPRPLQFPRDHGAHRCFQTEWWYYTGHLVEEPNFDHPDRKDAAPEGDKNIFQGASEYGFQFTIFRKGEQNGDLHRFMGHGALARLLNKERADIQVKKSENGAIREGEPTVNNSYVLKTSHGGKQSDLGSDSFTFAQVMGSENLGLAGASDDRLEVWVQDWKAEQFGDKHIIQYDLKDGTKVRLVAEQLNSPVLNGEEGKSRKADCEQCFSYYYSIPHLKISGEIVKAGQIKRVIGIGWMDHEFMTGAMEPNTIGWDWFSVYWPNGSSLMAFQLRRKDRESYLAGTYVRADGEITKLSGKEISLVPKEMWKSKSGTSYPTSWSLSVEKLDLHLKLSAMINDQVIEPEKVQSIKSLESSAERSDQIPPEYGASPEYWEGAIIDGEQNARGYLEMTGYQKPIGSLL